MQARTDQLCEIAANKDNISCDIQAFLKKENADINSLDALQQLSVVFAAAEKGSLDVLRYLIELPNINLKSGAQPLNIMHFAVHNTPDVIKFATHPDRQLWLEYKDGTTDLHADAAAGRTDEIKLKLSQDINRFIEINDHGLNVLTYATEAGHNDLVKLLLKLGTRFVLINLRAKNWDNLAKYYKLLGNYYKNITEEYKLSISAFENSIEYNKTLVSEHELAGSNVFQPTNKMTYLQCGDAYACLAKTYEDGSQLQTKILTYQKAINHYKETFKSKAINEKLAECYNSVGALYYNHAKQNVDNEMALEIVAKSIKHFANALSLEGDLQPDKLNLYRYNFALANQALGDIYYYRGQREIDKNNYLAANKEGYEKSITYFIPAIAELEKTPRDLMTEERQSDLDTIRDDLANAYRCAGQNSFALAGEEESDKQWDNALFEVDDSLNFFTLGSAVLEKIQIENRPHDYAEVLTVNIKNITNCLEKKEFLFNIINKPTTALEESKSESEEEKANTETELGVSKSSFSLVADTEHSPRLFNRAPTPVKQLSEIVQESACPVP